MGQICHHTTENRGNWKDIERDGPVFGTGKKNFFGPGYYFWANNVNQAMFWGKRQYNNNFYVFEGELEIDKNELFDTTDPDDIAFLKLAANEFYEQEVDISEFLVGALLSLFFAEESKTGVVYFPFRYAKAYDNNSTNHRNALKMYFNDVAKSHFVLNPIVFYCVFKKENLILNKFKRIYSR